MAYIHVNIYFRFRVDEPTSLTSFGVVLSIELYENSDTSTVRSGTLRGAVSGVATIGTRTINLLYSLRHPRPNTPTHTRYLVINW